MKFNKEKTLRILKNRWFLAAIAFVVIILFGTHSLIDLSQHRKELAELQKKRQQLEEKIRQDSINTIRMQTDTAFIEKFAREKYMFKRSNEDLYIIKEEK
ncbi:MAG: septum formation initiator family protein [Bacteroidales bacterium]|jgi:cell division protein FtsB|nr:septum formation initiator family protein [Bacteroidales bacterium]